MRSAPRFLRPYGPDIGRDVLIWMSRRVGRRNAGDFLDTPMEPLASFLCTLLLLKLSSLAGAAAPGDRHQLSNGKLRIEEPAESMTVFSVK